jgi:hypothetical protein
MSEITTVNGRDVKSGRFVAGNTGNGGRPKGARNKLGEAFVEDLRDCWNRRGIEVLERCADEDPAALLRVIASLMPKDLNLSIGLDAASFARTFQDALALLGNEAPRQIRKPLPGQPKVIKHHDG